MYMYTQTVDLLSGKLSVNFCLFKKKTVVLMQTNGLKLIPILMKVSSEQYV